MRVWGKPVKDVWPISGYRPHCSLIIRNARPFILRLPDSHSVWSGAIACLFPSLGLGVVSVTSIERSKLISRREEGNLLHLNLEKPHHPVLSLSLDPFERYWRYRASEMLEAIIIVDMILLLSNTHSAWGGALLIDRCTPTHVELFTCNTRKSINFQFNSIFNDWRNQMNLEKTKNIDVQMGIEINLEDMVLCGLNWIQYTSHSTI